VKQQNCSVNISVGYTPQYIIVFRAQHHFYCTSKSRILGSSSKLWLELFRFRFLVDLSYNEA